MGFGGAGKQRQIGKWETDERRGNEGKTSCDVKIETVRYGEVARRTKDEERKTDERQR